MEEKQDSRNHAWFLHTTNLKEKSHSSQLPAKARAVQPSSDIIWCSFYWSKLQGTPIFKERPTFRLRNVIINFTQLATSLYHKEIILPRKLGTQEVRGWHLLVKSVCCSGSSQCDLKNISDVNSLWNEGWVQRKTIWNRVVRESKKALSIYTTKCKIDN